MTPVKTITTPMTTMRGIDRALVTKELSKAQAAIWAALTIATRANDLALAKSLREQHKAMGAKIIEINGGPVLSMRELIR